MNLSVRIYPHGVCICVYFTFSFGLSRRGGYFHCFNSVLHVSFMSHLSDLILATRVGSKGQPVGPASPVRTVGAGPPCTVKEDLPMRLLEDGAYQNHPNPRDPLEKYINPYDHANMEIVS